MPSQGDDTLFTFAENKKALMEQSDWLHRYDFARILLLDVLCTHELLLKEWKICVKG
jgi:hypothetical protein